MVVKADTGKLIRLSLTERKILAKFVVQQIGIAEGDMSWFEKNSVGYLQSKKRFDDLCDLHRRLK